MKMNILIRFKNKAFLLFLASLIYKILYDLGIQIHPEQWDYYVNALMYILVFLGLLNNPTTKNDGLSDDN